ERSTVQGHDPGANNGLPENNNMPIGVDPAKSAVNSNEPQDAAAAHQAAVAEENVAVTADGARPIPVDIHPGGTVAMAGSRGANDGRGNGSSSPPSTVPQGSPARGGDTAARTSAGGPISGTEPLSAVSAIPEEIARLEPQVAAAASKVDEIE